MAKIKLTKNELKKQKDALKMYRRYLPTLLLKKQQLQMEIRAVEAKRAHLAARRETLEREFAAWTAVFGEAARALDGEGRPFLKITRVRTGEGNIAGVEIPVFEGVDFALDEYDLFVVPLWVDAAMKNLEQALLADIEIGILDIQVERLGAELRTTTQRVNLFEKVKIPETNANIKRIRIYLGDQQTAQVVRGKIAKRKVEGVAS